MNDTVTRSRLITVLGYAGVLCLLAMPLAVGAIRLGLDISVGLPAFALSAVVGLLLIIVLVIVSLLPKYRGQRSRALLWALPPLPPVLIFLSVISTAGDYPPIHDITTNTVDPPQFDAGVHYRGKGANPIDIKPDVIEIQKQHYTGLDTIRTEMTPEEAFARANAVAESL